MGGIYHPAYTDRKTGEKRQSAVWWIHYYAAGQLHRESTGSTNEAKAYKLLKQRIGAAAHGKPVGSAVERTSFEDLAQMLIDDYKANGRKSLRRIAGNNGDGGGGSLGHLREYFSGTRAKDITTDRIIAYTAFRRAEKAEAATINRELAALKRAIRLVARAAKVARVPDFSLLREDNARKGFFEPEQFQAVLKHLPDHLKPVFQVAYITGWRVPSEVLTRRWQHVDLEGGWLRLEREKARITKAARFR